MPFLLFFFFRNKILLYKGRSDAELYDVITVIILAAAVLYYFIVPAASDAVQIVQKAKNRPKDEEGPK